MRKFYSLTVYVDYRYDAGPDQPRDKILRARVACEDAEGPVYGSPITKKSIRDFSTLRTECVRALAGKCDQITFCFSALVPPSIYRDCCTVVDFQLVA